MEGKLISIILPVYNADKKELLEAINSVLSQTYKNIELLIINDASNNWIEKFLSIHDFKDKRVKVINNEKNLRLTKTLNKWLKLAKWEYIARIDDEDIWIDNEKLEKQVKFLEKNPDYWICWTNWIAIDKHWNVLFNLKWEETDSDIRNSIMQRCPFLHVSVVFKKSCISNCWWYSENRDYNEDHELRLRFWKKYKLYNLQDYCVKFKMDPDWISWRHKLTQRRNILKLWFLYGKYYPYWLLQIISNIMNLIIAALPLKFIQILMKLKGEVIRK